MRSNASSPSKTTPIPPTLGEVRAEQARRSLLRAVPFVSPKYSSPRHLGPLVDALQRAIAGEELRVVCSAPPRHAKTETVLHAIAWGLWKNPDLTFSFTTYADTLSRSKSRKARAIAGRFGVELDARAVGEWRTPAGGGVVAGGIGGPLTGHGVNIGIVDDPFKNRQQAESAAERKVREEFLDDVLETRIEPGGSIFLFGTRWTPDDLLGYALKKGGWLHINLPALNDAGEALWPERWSAESINKKRVRVGEYTFASLFQGRPRPRGGNVFGEPTFYSKLPTVFRSSHGLDLSYSAKTSSDYSVVVRMLYAAGKFYVVNVVRMQVRATQFKKVCRRLHKLDRHSPWRWYVSGTELGPADFFNEEPGVPVDAYTVSSDKFVRAMDYAAAWNRGDVLVPESAPWLDEFLDEHKDFTGSGKERDDQVDATTAAFDELYGSGPRGERLPTEPRAGARTGLAAEDL